MRRFAWYGRLSTKDKQDPTLSFPSQRSECAEKAKEPDARRFDAMIVYSTSRLSRDLFHALAYERELGRAGVEIFYAGATAPSGSVPADSSARSSSGSSVSSLRSRPASILSSSASESAP
ncbi:MAG: hypothetical protein JJE35_00140 [Thermoleophilia bacterium]|nr:hypothetical protein [Thermoleophilia bacterium]